MTKDALDPAVLLGLDLPADRLRALAEDFVEIRAEIDKLRELDLGETHPAVIFAPTPKP